MVIRLRSVLFWILPPLFCLAVYWLGLWAWFQRDDFAWLNLRREVHSWRDLLPVLFLPKAGGSIRPFSERGFFLLFRELFAFDALPYRVWVFATQLANIVLVNAVARRLTGSAIAGSLAAILWTANSTLAEVLTWTSAYNQVLCAFFLLTSFYLFVRYCETGRRTYYVAQFVTFILGFGALEMNVVYPGLAGLYALLLCRDRFTKTLPMLGVSIAYVVLHWSVAPKRSSGAYALHFDRYVFSTFGTYWQRVLSPDWWDTQPMMAPWFPAVLVVLLTGMLLGFAAVRARDRDFRPLFLLGWFAIALAPVLPLRDHVAAYYAVVPAVGLAIAFGMAAVWAWPRGHAARIAVLLLLATYLSVQVSAARTATRWFHEQSVRTRQAVLGTRQIAEKYPNKRILLTGVDDLLFWTAFYDRPFRAMALNQVDFAPGIKSPFWPRLETGAAQEYSLTPPVARLAISTGQAIVVDVSHERPMIVTAPFFDLAQKQWEAGVPRRIEVGDSLYAQFLGSTWHYPENNAYRWMPRRAALLIGGPVTAAEQLQVTAYCPKEQLQAGPLHLSILLDHKVIGRQAITQANRELHIRYALPPEVLGAGKLEMELDLDRTFKVPGDPRELGLAITRIEIR